MGRVKKGIRRGREGEIVTRKERKERKRRENKGRRNREDR